MLSNNVLDSSIIDSSVGPLSPSPFDKLPRYDAEKILAQGSNGLQSTALPEMAIANRPKTLTPSNSFDSIFSKTLFDNQRKEFTDSTVSEKQTSDRLSDADPITGIDLNTPLFNPDLIPQKTKRYSPISGYGLVNTNTAVAWSIGDASLPDLSNLEGMNIGNDMVNAPDAWTQGIEGQDVIVAVIDSGVDIGHPDLRDNIWVNADEIFGDGLDNDGNGYVDDIVGWNFGRNNYNILDYDGHGTHVAGTIAALDDGIGTTGVAPSAKIMPLKIGDTDSQGRFVNPGNLAQAIRYAVDNGADVINMSLGWPPSFELLDAFAYAAAQDVITVTAAGNSALAEPGSPGFFSTLYGLTVGAVDSSGQMARFSNWAGYDSRLGYVTAPGVDVFSTRPTNLSFRGYGFSSGTSMAAPHVSGVVALMLSANPDLTHDQVRSIITNSATDLSDYRTLTNPIAFSPFQSELFFTPSFNFEAAHFSSLITTRLDDSLVRRDTIASSTRLANGLMAGSTLDSDSDSAHINSGMDPSDADSDSAEIMVMDADAVLNPIVLWEIGLLDKDLQLLA